MNELKQNIDDMELKVTSYSNNDRLAILLFKKDGDLYGDLTINLERGIEGIDEGFISQDMNIYCPDLIKDMKRKGLIKKSYGFTKYNLGEYEYVKFDLEKLKQYDKSGIEEYLKQADENYFEILIGGYGIGI